jgi:hypothetical protein
VAATASASTGQSGLNARNAGEAVYASTEDSGVNARNAEAVILCEHGTDGRQRSRYKECECTKKRKMSTV